MSNVDAWANQNANKSELTPDPPHGINGQCVNSASSAMMFQGGPELFPGATAWDIWLNFQDPRIERVQAPYGYGDTVFYSPNNPAVGTGPAGHVETVVTPGSVLDLAATDIKGNPNLVRLNRSQTLPAGGFRVINQPIGGGMDSNAVKQVFRRVLFRLDGSYDAGWVGQPAEQIFTIMDSPEGQLWDSKVQALVDKANSADQFAQQIQSQQATIDQLNAEITALQQQPIPPVPAPAPTPVPPVVVNPPVAGLSLWQRFIKWLRS